LVVGFSSTKFGCNLATYAAAKPTTANHLLYAPSPTPGISIAKFISNRVTEVLNRTTLVAANFFVRLVLTPLFCRRPADVRAVFLLLAQFSSNEILSHKMRSHMERLRNTHRIALDTSETYLALRELVDANQFLLPARRLFHSVFQDLT
jgi:hypothetical protein